MTGALYFTSGAIAGILGVALLAWALFGDRSQGRKRCPKCWYDMSAATGLRCPECGREARSERTLHKTRRRWRWVLASLLPFALAAFLAVQPKVQREGWWSVMPTTVMLAYFSIAQDDAVIEAIDRRMTHQSALYHWQWKWLAQSVLSAMQDDDVLTYSQRETYILWACTVRDVLGAGAIRDSLADAVIAYLKHEESALREIAANYGTDLSRPDWTIAHLMPLLDDDESRVRTAAVTGLRMLLYYTGSEAALAATIQAMRHNDPAVRLFAAAALESFGLHGGRSVDAAHVLHAAINTPEEPDDNRTRYVQAYCALLDQPERLPFVRQSLMSSDPFVRAGGLDAMMRLDRNVRGPLFDFIASELLSASATEYGRWLAAEMLKGWDDIPQLRQYEFALRRLAAHSDRDTADAGRAALRRIGVHLEPRNDFDDADAWGDEEGP